MRLDIDETVDVVQGGQQPSFWNGHYGERCFLPLHVYDTATGRPLAMLLRTGKTPSRAEIAGYIRPLHRRIEKRWPDTRITLRGDSHYGSLEVMAWCKANKVEHVFGLPGNRTLHADPVIVAAADAVCVDRATRAEPVLRRYAETSYAAKSWGDTNRRVVARIEASTTGLDIRFVVTSLKAGSAKHIYDTLYCARGQAENLIELHKAQLKSDRTSCRSANASQMQLSLHTAAYWLMWTVREALPQTAALRIAEFGTIRLRLIKVAARDRHPYPHRVRQCLPCGAVPPSRRQLARRQPIVVAAVPPIKPTPAIPQAPEIAPFPAPPKTVPRCGR